MLTPSDYVRVTSTAAAQAFNVYPRKGRLAVGSDADVIVLDPNRLHVIRAATHHSRMDTNVYEGAGVPRVWRGATRIEGGVQGGLRLGGWNGATARG